jgi:hypothetical protein
MARRAEVTLVLLLAANTLPLAGCLTVAKQAFEEARGAQGEVLPITQVSETTLARYQSLEFTPATTAAGGRLCPPALLRAYDRAANRLAARLKTYYPGSAPTLTVDSEILYFQAKGLLSGAFMLTRVKMHEHDQLAVDALVKAESAAYSAGDEDDLADAAVHALGKFLKRAKPEKPLGNDPKANRY